MNDDIKKKIKNTLKSVGELALIYLTENGIYEFKDSQFLFENKYLYCKSIDAMYSNHYVQAYVYRNLNNNKLPNPASNILIPHHFVAWIGQHDKFVEKKKIGMAP